MILVALNRLMGNLGVDGSGMCLLLGNLDLRVKELTIRKRESHPNNSKAITKKGQLEEEMILGTHTVPQLNNLHKLC